MADEQTLRSEIYAQLAAMQAMAEEQAEEQAEEASLPHPEPQPTEARPHAAAAPTQAAPAQGAGAQVAPGKAGAAKAAPFDSRSIPALHLEQVTDQQQEVRYQFDALNAELAKTEDELNETIEQVLLQQRGIAGFILRAIRGSTVPPELGARIDALTEKLDILEEHRDAVEQALTKSEELLQRSQRSADIENVRMLRWRAMLALELSLDRRKLDAANRRLEAAAHRRAQPAPAEPAKKKTREPKEAPAKKLLTKRVAR